MAEYRISGVWKNSNDVITHYALHTKNSSGNYSKAEKATKEYVISLVEKGNVIMTMVWNYTKGGMYDGEKVKVVKKSNGEKYLRSDPDNHLNDNLGQAIDMTWYIN